MRSNEGEGANDGNHAETLSSQKSRTRIMLGG
jgi:hypothetical protein